MTHARLVATACAISCGLGFFFLFVWSPLPWGWEGIDHYHDRALQLLAGEGFQTTDVPWAYPYYLAGFYWMFGPKPWIPLIGQVMLNAAVPWLLYLLARRLANERIAVLSALLAGVLSFNTVYTSTQSTDSVCTVLLLVSLVLLESGVRRESIAMVSLSGAAVGLAMQFRPNLTLLPVVIVMLWPFVRGFRPRTVALSAAYLLCVLAMLTPWVVRNYRLTGAFIPTSTHGGIQLWYGSLQTGDYLEDWTRNPRSAFAPAMFPYSSVTEEPIVVEAGLPSCSGSEHGATRLVYWTSNDPTRRTLAPAVRSTQRVTFVVPAQPEGTKLSYYAEVIPSNGEPLRTPADGESRPLLLFVTRDHIGDLDRDDDFLDIFDLVRVMRGADPGNAPMVYDLAARIAAGAAHELDRSAMSLDASPAGLALHLGDGGTLFLPPNHQKLTDIVAHGDSARALIYARVRREPPDLNLVCAQAQLFPANDVFYRREVHLQRRYVALALDNIAAAPFAYAESVAYRAWRLFVIRGSDDPSSAHQFGGSTVIYGIGAVMSAAYFIALVTGAFIAVRRCRPALLLLVPILYVPATISFVLTNMRYSITVQPYAFVFVALTLLSVAGWVRGSRSTLRA